jgi:hypothetical protein
MKLGLSTYSLTRAIKSGEMTVIQALEWMKTYGRRRELHCTPI